MLFLFPPLCRTLLPTVSVSASVFTTILPEISPAFTLIHPSVCPLSVCLPLSCGSGCRQMYVPSPYPTHFEYGSTLALNQFCTAPFSNLYEWPTFSDEFPAKSNHISLVRSYGTASTFFRKCRWTIRKYRPCLLTPESSFFRFPQKEYSGINHLLPSYPINNIRIFLFLQA